MPVGGAQPRPALGSPAGHEDRGSVPPTVLAALVVIAPGSQVSARAPAVPSPSLQRKQGDVECKI